MKAIINLGKYLFAIPMLVFGIMHFAAADDMAAMAPGGKMMVYFTGLALIAFAVSVFIGKMDKLASLLLALMLLLFVILIHAKGLGGTEAEMQAAMPMLLKDIGLAGGALMYAGSLAKDDAVVG